MRVLITGITGFVGSHMTEHLLKETDVEIYGLARWRSSKENIEHILSKISLIEGDLTDLSSLNSTLDEIRPDIILHYAAQSYVPYSFRVPIATLDANCIGTCNLLEAIRISRRSVTYDPTIMVVSSSEVYGQVKEDEIPIKETNPLRPASPYAVSKVCEDMLGYQYWASWQMKIVRTRAFSHSGPRRGEIFVLSNFAKQIASIELGLQKPTIYVGNLESIRTFADVRDMVLAYWLIAQKGKYGEVYNIGGNKTLSIGDLLRQILLLSTVQNIEVKQEESRLRPSDVTLQIPDCSKFKAATGWEPQIPFEQTLSDTLDYWRQKLKVQYA